VAKILAIETDIDRLLRDFGIRTAFAPGDASVFEVAVLREVSTRWHGEGE
jgi:hypothetical protein